MWAKINHPEITEDNDNGEWCFCDEFEKMYDELAPNHMKLLI